MSITNGFDGLDKNSSHGERKIELHELGFGANKIIEKTANALMNGYGFFTSSPTNI